LKIEYRPGLVVQSVDKGVLVRTLKLLFIVAKLPSNTGSSAEDVSRLQRTVSTG